VEKLTALLHIDRVGGKGPWLVGFAQQLEGSDCSKISKNDRGKAGGHHDRLMHKQEIAVAAGPSDGSKKGGVGGSLTSKGE